MGQAGYLGLALRAQHGRIDTRHEGSASISKLHRIEIGWSALNGTGRLAMVDLLTIGCGQGRERGCRLLSACSDVITCMIDVCQPCHYNLAMPREKTHPFQMRVSPEWLSVIDEWRRKQPDLPSRAEAIRRLVEKSLVAD